MSTAMKYDRLVNALPRLRPAHHDPAQPKYELHPLAEIFPPPSKVDLFQLAEDIRRAGGSAPILKSGDKIIDDRGRFEACKIAKVRIEFREWDGSDSLATTIARLNLPRVHLTESQRAAIAVPLADQISAENSAHRTAGLLKEKWKPQDSEKTAFAANPTVALKLGRWGNGSPNPEGRRGDEYERAAETAAQICHVSHAYVELAQKIRRESPSLFEDVRSGKLNLSPARIRLHPNSLLKKVSPSAGSGQALRRTANDELVILRTAFARCPSFRADGSISSSPIPRTTTARTITPIRPAIG